MGKSWELLSTGGLSEDDFEIIETPDGKDDQNGWKLPLVHVVHCGEKTSMGVHQLFNELRRTLLFDTQEHRVLVIGPRDLTNFFWQHGFMAQTTGPDYCHVRKYCPASGNYTVKGSLQQPGGRWPSGRDLENTVNPGGLLILDQYQELESGPAIEFLQSRARNLLALTTVHPGEKSASSFDTIYRIERSAAFENPCLTANPLRTFPLRRQPILDHHFDHHP